MLLDNKTKSNENGYFKVFDLLSNYVETGRVDIVTGYFSASAIFAMPKLIFTKTRTRAKISRLLEAQI